MHDLFFNNPKNIITFFRFYFISAGKAAEGRQYAMRLAKIKTWEPQWLFASSFDMEPRVDMTRKNKFTRGHIDF